MTSSLPKSASASVRASSVLPTPVGSQEEEAPVGPVGVGEPRARPANRLRNGFDSLVLADDALVQPFLELQEPVTFLLGQLRDRDSGAPRHDLGDVLRRNLRCAGAGFLPTVLLGTVLVDLRLQLVRPLVVLGRDRLVALTPDPAKLLLGGPRVLRLRLRAEPNASARLVDQIDRLVREEAVADVAVGQLRRRDDRLLGDAHAVERLVAVLEAREDFDRLLHRRLGDEHWLEAPLERGILLDVIAVFVERRRADHVQFSARERRLEHVAGVHRSLCGAGADDGVDLVDEDDQAVGVVADLVDHALEALLELAAVLRPGDHAGHVERHQALACERLRHIVVHDSLRDPLDDRGLADAGIAEEHRVVLRAPREDLDRLLDLVGAADDRVELALPRLVGEVAAVFVERLRRARRPAAGLAALDAADDRAAQLRMRDPEPLEQLARLGLGIAREREQDVLGPHIGRPDLARLLVGRQKRGLRVR